MSVNNQIVSAQMAENDAIVARCRELRRDDPTISIGKMAERLGISKGRLLGIIHRRRLIDEFSLACNHNGAPTRPKRTLSDAEHRARRERKRAYDASRTERRRAQREAAKPVAPVASPRPTAESVSRSERFRRAAADPVYSRAAMPLRLTPAQAEAERAETQRLADLARRAVAAGVPVTRCPPAVLWGARVGYVSAVL